MTDNIPSTMLASVLVAPRLIELNRVPLPAVGDMQVLVRVEAVGVCGSDTHFYENGRIGDIVVDGPIVLGHESAGTIVAVGADVDPSRIGDRVSVEPQKVCRRCRYCLRGEYHLCRSVAFYGAWPVDGSFAEYEVIDDDFAHRIPDEMSFEQAAMAEPVSVAVHAVRKAGVTVGSRVLITGAGPIGVLNAQVARSFGAAEVVITDPVGNRRQYAEAHGATRAIDPGDGDLSELNEHFDVYIDASGNASAIASAIPAIRSGGTAVLVGMGGDDLTLPIAIVQHREITVTGTFRYVNTWPTAIQLISSGEVEVASLVTGRHGLHEVANALMTAKTDPTAIKTMVVPSMSTAD